MDENEGTSLTWTIGPEPPKRLVSPGLERLLDQLVDAAVAVDAEGGRIVHWNPAAATLLGYRREEALGMAIAALAPGRPWPHDAEGTVEVQASTATGEPVWLELSRSPLDAGGGSALDLYLLRDVSHRRPAVRTLEHQRDHVQKLLDHLPAAVGYMTRDLTLDTVNKAWADRYGKTPADFIGRHVTEVYPADIVRQMEGQLAQILERGEPINVVGLPLTIHDADGRPQVVYRDVSAIPIRDEAGEVEGSLSLSFDATPRVLLEKALAERSREAEQQKALLESVIKEVPAGIAFLDRDLVVRWVNPEYLRLTQRPPAYFLDRHILADVAPHVRAYFEPSLQEVVETGRPFHAKATPHAYVVNGETRQTYWDRSYVPVFDEAGAIKGLLIFALEVSERVEKERLQGERIDALEQADVLKDQFLTILSHELRTPLNAILGFTSILDDEVAGPLTPEQHAYLGKILGGTEILLALINDLLDMSRIQAGKFSLSPAPVDLAEVCEGAVGNLQDAASRKALALRFEAETGLPELVADGQRVGQVLYNLIYNAIKFTPEGGRIDVRAARRGDRLRCEVRDTGIGIPAHHLPRLFQPFQQVDASRTRQTGGTGLGLSISKALVEAHGGTIGVESEPGAGSTFWFELPLPG